MQAEQSRARAAYVRLTTFAGRLDDGKYAYSWHQLGSWAVVPAWLGVVALLFCAVWLLFSFAPAQGEPPGWASAGALLVVAGWVVTSLGYGAWVGISSYGSPAGVLLAFLLLTTYLLVSSVILLAGFELDEQVRRRTR